MASRLRSTNLRFFPRIPTPQRVSCKREPSLGQGSLLYRGFRFFSPIEHRLQLPWGLRGFSHGTVSLVIRDGKPKFETQEYELPKKQKWMTKKRLKMKRKMEKQRRKEANKKDPRCLRKKGMRKNPRFPDAEARLKYKIEKARFKEALLVEKLKKYEVATVQGPAAKPETLSGEERFYMNKMAQKGSNYVPVGRRGIFGGVILNMHLHWKKHETVKVICKPCKPGQVHEYAREIARLSGGTPIQVIGDDTIIFYRGKNYVQPEIMSPVDTLSKKRALEKSKYEQSLETVRHFIAISEKELELYCQHMALYGDRTSSITNSACADQKGTCESRPATPEVQEEQHVHPISIGSSENSLGTETDCYSEEILELESDFEPLSTSEDFSEVEDNEESVHNDVDTDDSDSGFTDEECEASDCEYEEQPEDKYDNGYQGRKC